MVVPIVTVTAPSDQSESESENRHEPAEIVPSIDFSSPSQPR